MFASDKIANLSRVANLDKIIDALNEIDYNTTSLKDYNDKHHFLQKVVVRFNIIAPLYWWREFDILKVDTFSYHHYNMKDFAETIFANEFTLDDFSHEHMESDTLHLLESTIFTLNTYRQYFNKKDFNDNKIPLWQIIQILPSSYNQKRTILINYEDLAKIYNKYNHDDHILDEWDEFCKYAETLPYFKLIAYGYELSNTK